MKKYILIIIFALCATTAFAQLTKDNDYGINKLRLEVRTDFDCFSDGDTIKSGFTGKYLNFVLFGDLSDNLFYAYRQRINNTQSVAKFFDATDYLYLGWRITKNLSLTAGKEIVAIGGIEYDLAPIDVYFNSRFWDNINCFRFGTNLEYTTNSGNNTFVLQFTNSPFDKGVVYGSLYNYSFLWRADFKHFKPVCSVNMLEYKKNSFLNIIALGTGFEFGPVVGYIDFANRGHGDQYQFFFKDMTAICRIGVNMFKNKLHIYGKSGCDINDSQDYTLPVDKVHDLCVPPGTDVAFAGGGIEYFPITGNHDLRIHAFFAASDVRRDVEVIETLNTLTGALESTYGETDSARTSYQFNIGLTWKIRFIDK